MRFWVPRILYELKDNAVYLCLIALGVIGVSLSAKYSLGEYVSLFFAKPVLKMLVVGLIARHGFTRINFQTEILSGNISAAIVFLGVCVVIAFTI